MKNNFKLFGYQIINKLGEGSFGEVLLGIKEGKKVAIKKISKKQIIKVNKLHEPFIQKAVLQKLQIQCPKQPYFIRILQTESDEDNIYLILEYCSGGTLQQLNHQKTLSPQLIKRIAAKLWLIIQKLHQYNIVHRDIKPSNFLIDHLGYIKLADFATAIVPYDFFEQSVAQEIKQIKKISLDEQQKKKQQNLQNLHQRRSTFVGTACYMAPQLLSHDICSKQSDIWAFGCILYELMHKKSPFFDSNQGMVWKKIVNQQLKFEEETKEQDKKLGSGENGSNNIRNHQFFKGIDWQIQIHTPIKNSSIMQKQQELEKSKQKDKILLSGVVGKKAFFGNFKQRNLVLYSTPRLVYYDSESGQFKGQIFLQKQTPVNIDGQTFSITTSKKTYVFKSKKALQWIQMIKSAIINAYY